MLGAIQLALSKTHLRQIIRDNGHLVQEGNETIAELREAAMYLWLHGSTECQNPSAGVPMDTLLPRLSDLTVVSASHENVVNVDMSSESL